MIRKYNTKSSSSERFVLFADCPKNYMLFTRPEAGCGIHADVYCSLKQMKYDIATSTGTVQTCIIGRRHKKIGNDMHSILHKSFMRFCDTE